MYNIFKKITNKRTKQNKGRQISNYSKKTSNLSRLREQGENETREKKFRIFKRPCNALFII